MLRLDGVIDIEAANWTDIVTCAAYSPSRGSRAWRHLPDLVDHLLRWGGTWWSWAGGRYDMIAILEELRRRGIYGQINASGSRVTSITAGHLTLRDAYAICPLSLDDACALAERPPVGPIGWPCRCGAQCGGYCQIRRALSLDRYATLAAYCQEDCRAGYQILAALFEHMASHGMNVRGTVGATAYATAEERLGLPKAEWSADTWRRVRRACYGGRMHVGRAHAAGGRRWDMGSAYPHQLARLPIPCGPVVELGSQRAAAAYGNEVPGTYRVTIDIPPMHLPPLPWRTALGRVAYPYGEIRGTWTAIEIQAAEARGARILAFHGAQVWPDGARTVFAPVIEEWYVRRAAAGKRSAWGRWYHELMVSITGKLAERPERTAVVMNPDPDTIKVCDCGRRKGDCRCRAWSQLDRYGRFWGVPVWRIGSSAHVQWNAYLTAGQRLSWLAAAEQAGHSEVVYGNTDSLWITDTGQPPPDTGPGLGQWDELSPYADWRCHAPNRYRYTDGATGEVVCRVSSLSRITDREWRALENGKQVVDRRGVQTFGEAVSSEDGRLWRRRDRRGKLTADPHWRGDRILALSDGRTYPASRDQINERDRIRAAAHAGRAEAPRQE